MEITGQTGPHELIEQPEIKLVGLMIDCPGFDIGGIGPLWEEFFGRWEEVNSLPGSVNVWGASLPAEDGFRYMCAFRFEDFPAELPAGFATASAPAGKYLRVPWKGPGQEMHKAFQSIFHELMPELGYSIKPGFTCLENYPDDCWDETTQTLKLDLLVELK